MKNMWNWLKQSLIVTGMLLGVLGATAAHAQQPTCELVNTNVDVDFGSTELGGVSVDAVANNPLTLSCWGRAGRQEIRRGIFAFTDTLFRVCVGLGSGSGGDASGQRLMKNGANSVQYQLYRNPQRTIPIGSIGGGGGSLNTNYDQSATLASNGNVTYRNILITLEPFYGRIAAGQSTVSPGLYSSTFASAGDVQIKWGSSTNFRGAIPPVPPCEQLTDTVIHPGFQAKVNIVPACALISVPAIMDFGTSSTPGAVVDIAAGLSMRCSQGVGYTIGLDQGNTFLGGQRNMRLIGGSIMHTVPYNLYRNAARTQLWRDNPTADVVQGTGSGQNQTYTIYGRATVPDPIPTVGQFQDTVVIKLYY